MGEFKTKVQCRHKKYRFHSWLQLSFCAHSVNQLCNFPSFSQEYFNQILSCLVTQLLHLASRLALAIQLSPRLLYCCQNQFPDWSSIGLTDTENHMLTISSYIQFRIAKCILKYTYSLLYYGALNKSFSILKWVCCPLISINFQILISIVQKSLACYLQ